MSDRNRCVTMPPGRGAAVELAVKVFESAGPSDDFRVVAERMYRALRGVEVSPFPARKGLKGLPLGRPSTQGGKT